MVYELLLVTAVVFVAALPFIYLAGNVQTGWRHYVFQFYLLGVMFAYFSAFWLRSGQTLAMKTWRIRLTGPDDGRLTMKQAALRFALAGLVPALALAGYGWSKSSVWPWIFFGCLGFLWALFDRDRQFFHDRIVGTRLVRVPRKT